MSPLSSGTNRVGRLLPFVFGGIGGSIAAVVLALLARLLGCECTCPTP